MSRIRQTDWDAKVLSIACPTCDAKPGAWCKARTGRRANVLHHSRWLAHWVWQ